MHENMIFEAVCFLFQELILDVMSLPLKEVKGK